MLKAAGLTSAACSIEETAVALGVSPATVKRELRSARAWLAAELGGDPAGGAG